jgi:hypothetical protein
MYPGLGNRIGYTTLQHPRKQYCNFLWLVRNIFEVCTPNVLACKWHMVTEPEGSTALIPQSGRLLDTILSQFQPPIPTTCSPSSSYPSFFFSVLRVDILRRFLLRNPLWFLVSPNLAAYQVYINRLDLTILKTVALVLPRSTHEKYENFPRSRLCFVLRISYLGVTECFVLRHVSQLRSEISSNW